MQEREHVKTVPGEAKAPEVVPNPIRVEEDSHVQTDDINIPLVAISVAVFAVMMLVLVFGLQAWFYNEDSAERRAQTVAEGSPGTALGDLMAKQEAELNVTGPTPNLRMGKDSKVMRIPMTQAMDDVISHYATAQGNSSKK